jgi:hypothetical protein
MAGPSMHQHGEAIRNFRQTEQHSRELDVRPFWYEQVEPTTALAHEQSSAQR